MFRMNGMPQVQGCAGAAMFRMNGSLFDILSTRHSYVLYIICRGRKDAQEQLPRSNFLLVRTRLESSEIDSGFKWRGK